MIIKDLIWLVHIIANQEALFSISVKTCGLKLPPEEILCVWDWEWTSPDNHSDIDLVSASSFEDQDHNNPYIRSHIDSDVEKIPETQLQTHTIRFKCIGTTHDFNAQETLCMASKKLYQGEQVPVKLVPEPDNQYDAKAIRFVCTINGKCCRIGYIVREPLDHVHAAFEGKKILQV